MIHACKFVSNNVTAVDIGIQKNMMECKEHFAWNGFTMTVFDLGFRTGS